MSAIVEAVGDLVEGVGDAIGDAFEFVGDVVEAALNDPVGTIVQVAGAMVGIPPYITAGALTAARGGDLGDIAKSAAAAYVGQTVGQAVGTAVSSNVTASQTLGTTLGSQQTAMLAAQNVGLVAPSFSGQVLGAISGAAAGGAASQLIMTGEINMDKLGKTALIGGTVAVVDQLAPNIPGFDKIPKSVQQIAKSAAVAAMTGGNVEAATIGAAVNQLYKATASFIKTDILAKKEAVVTAYTPYEEAHTSYNTVEQQRQSLDNIEQQRVTNAQAAATARERYNILEQAATQAYTDYTNGAYTTQAAADTAYDDYVKNVNRYFDEQAELAKTITSSEDAAWKDYLTFVTNLSEYTGDEELAWAVEQIKNNPASANDIDLAGLSKSAMDQFGTQYQEVYGNLVTTSETLAMANNEAVLEQERFDARVSQLGTVAEEIKSQTGLEATDEQLIAFANGNTDTLDAEGIKQWVDDRNITDQEIKDRFVQMGYEKPSDAQVKYIKTSGAVSDAEILEASDQYAQDRAIAAGYVQRATGAPATQQDIDKVLYTQHSNKDIAVLAGMAAMGFAHIGSKNGAELFTSPEGELMSLSAEGELVAQPSTSGYNTMASSGVNKMDDYDWWSWDTSEYGGGFDWITPEQQPNIDVVYSPGFTDAVYNPTDVSLTVTPTTQYKDPYWPMYLADTDYTGPTDTYVTTIDSNLGIGYNNAGEPVGYFDDDTGAFISYADGTPSTQLEDIDAPVGNLDEIIVGEVTRNPFSDINAMVEYELAPSAEIENLAQTNPELYDALTFDTLDQEQYSGAEYSAINWEAMLNHINDQSQAIGGPKINHFDPGLGIGYDANNRAVGFVDPNGTWVTYKELADQGISTSQGLNFNRDTTGRLLVSGAGATSGAFGDWLKGFSKSVTGLNAEDTASAIKNLLGAGVGLADAYQQWQSRELQQDLLEQAKKMGDLNQYRALTGDMANLTTLAYQQGPQELQRRGLMLNLMLNKGDITPDQYNTQMSQLTGYTKPYETAQLGYTGDVQNTRNAAYGGGLNVPSPTVPSTPQTAPTAPVSAVTPQTEEQKFYEQYSKVLAQPKTTVPQSSIVQAIA